MSDTPFAPFVPPSSAPNETAAPETAKEKKAREKREAKEAKAAAKAQGAPAEPRQKRKAANGSRTLKFDLQTILGAASTLNQDDYPLFEKLINLLDEAGKPGRERLLAAIQKVFA